MADEAQTIDVVDEVLRRYRPEPASLISVLQDVQEDLNYLPQPALERISATLGVPRNQTYHVATFFKAFSLKPRGRHTISICRGTACHVKGAEKVADMLRAELKVLEGETTEDGLFTVQSVRCLGCCSLAPALMIDCEAYGEITQAGLSEILLKYANGNRHD